MMSTLKISLKAARINAGLTMLEAAKQIGISIHTLRKYEHGQAYPSIPEIKKIESAYAVCYNDIVF